MSEPYAEPYPTLRCTCQEWERKHGATNIPHPDPKCPYHTKATP